MIQQLKGLMHSGERENVSIIIPHNSSLFFAPVVTALNLNMAAPCRSTVAVIVPEGLTVVVTFPNNNGS
jgi:hypothetical protein